MTMYGIVRPRQGRKLWGGFAFPVSHVRATLGCDLRSLRDQCGRIMFPIPEGSNIVAGCSASAEHREHSCQNTDDPCGVAVPIGGPYEDRTH